MLKATLAAGTLLIFAHDTAQLHDPSLKRWIEGLTDKDGRSCCAGADGVNPEDTTWDIGEDHYKVKIGGTWYVVPNDKVITEPNRLGHAHVWYYVADGEVFIRCFLPGTGG